MIYSAIYGEVQALAFDTSATVLAQIKNWITAREGEIWQYANWPIKDSSTFLLAVTNGNAEVDIPASFSSFISYSEVLQIHDNFGNELEYLEPAEFYNLFHPYLTIAGATAEYWTYETTVAAGVVTLHVRFGPTPNVTTNYTVRGWTSPVCRSSATAFKAGTMSADADLPWWPDAYHYFLIPGAIAYGKRLRDGLGWEALESDFQQGLRRLQQELMPPQREVEIWGESPACY